MNTNKEIYEGMFFGFQGRKQKEVKAALKALNFSEFCPPDYEPEAEAVFNLDQDLDLLIEWDPTTGVIGHVVIDEIIPR